MTKQCITIFSTFVLVLSFYAVQNQTGYINSFMETGAVYVAVRVALVAILLAYTFIPKLRTFFARDVLTVAGLALMAFAVTATVSPTLLGSLQSFFPFGDAVMLFEAGILARLVSIELPAYQPHPVENALENSLVKYDSSLASFQMSQMAEATPTQRKLATKHAYNL